MTIMYPGDSQPDRVPAVFDDRVIFGYPDQSPPPQPPPRKGGGGGMTGALVMFAVMLIPCAILGLLVWNLTSKMDEIETATKVGFEKQIAELTSANTGLTAAVAERDRTITGQEGSIRDRDLVIASFSPQVRKLIEERQERVKRIGVLLTSAPDGEDRLPADLRDMPPWDTDAIRILTDHNKKLDDYEKRLRARPVSTQPTVPGKIGPGNPN